ncbi:MAG: hypothetical protein Q9221_005077 [Calogaya cf. arnoldii]
MVFKLSVALVGALAVVAQAGFGRRHVQQQYKHPKSLPYGNNQTSTVVDTSSTVANSLETTSTAPLETFPTFTPDSSTPVYGSPSSSVFPTAPLTTAPSGTSDNSPVPTSGNHTLTYTLGTGSSTTVVTTTIVETSTKTNIKTAYATSDSEAGVTGSAGGDSEPTTTIISTSTSTIYRTIKASASASANGLVDNNPVGASGSSECAVPVTVTVTGSPVTVTVTASSSSSESPETTQSSFSSSAPFPISSGTEETKTLFPTASSGFITKPYPTFTDKPSADITFSHPTSTGVVGYM